MENTSVVPIRPARLTKKFEPKVWKPMYDQFVYYHCLGKSNIWIAEKFSKSPQTVCNVLTSDQGKVHKKLLQYNMRQEASGTISERLQDVTQKFMRRIEQVADDDELFERSPFAVIDRGLSIMKGLNHMKGDTGNGGMGGTTNINVNNNQKIQVISEEAARGLIDAIKLSDEVKMLHNGNPSEGVTVHEKVSKAS